MNWKQFKILLLLATILGLGFITTPSLTQEEPVPTIQFGKARGSSGCSVKNQLTGRDRRTLAILLDNMSAANGKRKNCVIQVDTIIPNGFHVQNVQILYQGSTEVPSGGNTSLSRDYKFTGRSLEKVAGKPLISEYTSSNPLFQEQDEFVAASASCGGQGLIGIHLIALSSPGASIIIDTADLNAGDVKIYFDLARC